MKKRRGDTSREFLDNLPEIVFELDSRGKIAYVNLKAEAVLGYSRDELLGRDALSMITPETREAVTESLSDYMYMTYWFLEVEILGRDGRKAFPARVSASPIMRDGRINAVRGLVMDISMRKNLEERLRHSEERFRRLSDAAQEAIVFHENGIIRDCNRAFSMILGYSAQESVNLDFISLILPEWQESMRRLLTQQEGKLEARARRKDGTAVDIECIAGSYKSGGEGSDALIIQDITHRKRYEFIQEHEELTGLLNVRGFLRRLKEEMSSSAIRHRKIAVMTIRVNPEDIALNVNLDSEVEKIIEGAVPVEIAERFRSVFFTEDVMARVAEYEFQTMHLLPGEHEIRNSAKLINKALSVFSRDFIGRIRLGGYVGITFYPDDYPGDDAEQVINNSRYACDEARRRNRDYMFYDENSHRETREGIEFMRDLLRAVKRDGCRDFVLHYQPKVNNMGTIVGMEALLRWRSERWNDHGKDFVMPDRFIRVAEETGLITEIGNWVLEKACMQAREWQSLDPRFRDLKLSVNVSPSQLSENFASTLADILERAGLSPSSLEIEITERETVKDRNVPILANVRAMGITVAIDDFGIDYSALSRLPKLAIDTIKLDKSYIDEIARDRDYENLVYHTIRMVHDFDYSVVAEGVEDHDQVMKLFNDMGCDHIQGFYFYRPMSPEEFLEELRRNREEKV